MESDNGFLDRVIRTSEADQECNCHGWVFAQGRFWVRGANVDAILEDNGYVTTETAQPDDVVIYRNAKGKVIHSALVRSVASEGLLVESKWGKTGRFIHPHDRHPYVDARCSFYRSPRQGHLLRDMSATVPDETPAVPAPTLAPCP